MATDRSENVIVTNRRQSVYNRVKRIIYLSLIMCLMLGTVSVFGAPQAALASVGTFRTTGDVNVRSEPSTDASVVTVVYNSSNVEVLEHNPAGWSRVQVGSHTGFIRSDFLKFPVGSTAPTFRTTDGVNVRASGSVDSKIIDKVVAGTSVELLEHNPAGWSKVRVNSNTGFIRSDFLTRGGGTSQNSGGGSSTSSGDVIATLKTTGLVNFRTSASSSNSSNMITTLAANTSVDVLENRSDGWSRVRHNGTDGFIKTEFISASGASGQAAATLKTVGIVNLRARASASSSLVRQLQPNTSVDVVEVVQANSESWTSVRHNGTAGFIRSDLLSEAGAPAGGVIATLRTVGSGVRIRSGPSTQTSILKELPNRGTAVSVLENQSNGWSKVSHDGTVGFIRSDLLGPGHNIELIDWSEARNLIRIGTNVRITDVYTGISYTLRVFSKSGHADVEPPTRADTDAKLRTRNGAWAWTPRPVWATVGNRTFAAAVNGMPHDVSTIRDNGINGHFCLHFNNTVTISKSYQRNLNNAVVEAWNRRQQ
jgi:uncharacterized protein YgiM (DUF1202 family)